MPRSGGESDKLGNRFEGIWTVDSCFDLLEEKARSLTVEPLAPENLGIEFVKVLPDGAREYHSAKRQTSEATWRVSSLAEQAPNGRSVLRDLFTKVATGPTARAVFVSATTANDLDELNQIATRAESYNAFEARLSEQPRLKQQWDRYIVPLLGQPEPMMWELFRRIGVVGCTERELIRRVEHRISYQLYRPDGRPVDPLEVRLRLGEAVVERLGQGIGKETLVEILAKDGFRERDWQRDVTVRETVEKRNVAYLRDVRGELINGTPIPRREADVAVTELTQGQKRRVVIVGAAGLGKSCVVAQVADGLTSASVPLLALRMDIQTNVLTAEGLGRELGMPVSPVLVLAGLAGGCRSVLLVDQLDALSSASGRNQHLWTLFEELLAEVARFPEMRVLLSCRGFDASHDHRIRKLLADETMTHRVELGVLPIEVVRIAVAKGGFDSQRLSESDLKLLQTPQTLSLFLQGDPGTHRDVGSIQTLLDRYWVHKQRLVEKRLGRGSQWPDVIRRLAVWLSEHQTLSAPADVLDAFQTDVAAMASEHVLALDSNNVRFFHETVFDYAFARTYVAEGGSASALLVESGTEQHFFRRAQVRQVLTYERGRDFRTYLDDLKRVLTEPKVRVHIKKLVLDWLRSLPDPAKEEWALVQSLEGIPPYEMWPRFVPYGSIPWFDLLLQDDTWARWLNSLNEDEINHATRLLSVAVVAESRGDEIAALIGPHLKKGGRWKERFTRLLSFGKVHKSRALFDHLKAAYSAGWLDDTRDHWWLHFHELPTSQPDWAAELLVAFIDRQCQRCQEGDPFGNYKSTKQLPEDFPLKIGQASPLAMITRVLPRVVMEVERRIVVAKDGANRDAIWPWFSLGLNHGFSANLLQGLMVAMTSLAKETPSEFARLCAGLEYKQSRTVAMLLLKAWSANPPVFADKAADYLGSDPHRLDIQYDVTSGIGGASEAGVSRAAIEVISPLCSLETYCKLEAAILAYRNTWEGTKPRQRGFMQYTLLHSLAASRRSPAARLRFEELSRKFPDVDFSAPEPIAVRSIGSPISVEVAKKMNDPQWISAMRKYAGDQPRSFKDYMKGGCHELSGTLTHEAQNDRTRFAKLALTLPNNINPTYYDAIIRGIAKVNVDGAEKPQSPAAKTPLEMALLGEVFRRAHALPDRPCGRTICDAVRHAAERDWPDDIIAIVGHYAVADPDPDSELWQAPMKRKTPHCGGDPLTAGINSVRGEAAWTLGALLFADKRRWPKLRHAIEQLVADRSVAVRSCVVKPLIALLNVDRDEAVRLFLLMVVDASEVLATGEVDSFLHYAVQTHYAYLAPTLRSMLISEAESARETAARQVAVASFREPLAEADLVIALAGDEACRSAAAGVFAHNFSQEQVRAICRTRLPQFFHDPAKKVRDVASGCFRHDENEFLADEREFIAKFIESPAFADGAFQFLVALKETNALLPDVVCVIPGKFIELHRKSGSTDPIGLGGEAYQVPELILRLYRQSTDETVRSRCLDIMDEMLLIGFGDLENELAKAER